MKIVCISDTHCMLEKVKLPEGDLLIHSGDLTFIGDIKEIVIESNKLDKVKNRYTHGIVFTPGNHDWLFQRNEALAREIMKDTKVFIDQSLRIENLNIYGSPWQPWFHNWAFNLPRNGAEIGSKWQNIPDDTNILITHGPPYGIRDIAQTTKHAGCELLFDKVRKLKELQLHVFGHLHEGYGKEEIKDTLFVNASNCNDNYKPVNKPIIVEL